MDNFFNQKSCCDFWVGPPSLDTVARKFASHESPPKKLTDGNLKMMRPRKKSPLPASFSGSSHSFLGVYDQTVDQN